MEKTHKCEICSKTFYLKWRLSKHTSNHAGSHKPYKYIQERNVCPFDEVGCKFQHNEANINDAEQDAERCDKPRNNFCNLCDVLFGTQDDLIAHMGDEHLDQFPHIQQDDLLMTFIR